MPLSVVFAGSSEFAVVSLEALQRCGAAPAAVLTQPDALIPISLVMGAGWFVTMNFIQPRVMSSAVGIHTVVVLLSVLIGLRLQGFIGAIFAIPVAAVISAFLLLATGSGQFADVQPEWELVPLILTASLVTMLPGAIVTSRLGRTRMSVVIATVSISLALLALARTLFF